MTRSGLALTQQIERMAASAGKTNTELLTIRAATAGVSDATLKLVQGVGAANGAFASAGVSGTQAFASITAAATGATTETSSLLTTLVARIRDVNAQAAALKSDAVAKNTAGTLPDADLKSRLAGIAAVRDATLKQLNLDYAANKAAAAAAAEEVASSQARSAAAQRVIDVQNGLTTTYRTQLQALRELRDAGNLSAEQFKKAGTDLLAKQPIAQQAEAQAAAARAFVASLDAEASAIGKTRTELLSLRAAQLGVADQAAPLIARLGAAEKTVGGFAKTAKLTAFESQQLGFQIHDFVVQVVSGQSPITALVQQGSQLSGTFGGTGNAVKVLTSFITPLRVALTAGASAAGLFAYSLYEGGRQSKAFADSLVLTGGFAGVTEGAFNALAKSVAASGQVTVGVAREFGQALISTGQIGPQVLAAATAAAAKYGEATGQTAKDVAQDYASMAADVTKWATEHNRQLNFLSLAQFNQIKTLQEQGHAADAQGIVYDALNKRFGSLDQNLGLLERTLKGAKSTWSAFWDAALDVGRAETIEDKIAKNQAAIARFESSRTSAAQPGEGFRIGTSSTAPVGPKTAETLRENTVELQRLKITQDNAAATIADRAATTQRAIAGQAIVDQYAKEGKSADLYKEKLRQLTQSFKDNADAGSPISAERQRAALKGLKDSFTDKSGVSESNAQRKALLDQDLKRIRDNLTQEQDALRFNEQALQAIYAGSNVSLKDYFDARRQTTAAGVQAELAALTDEQTRLQSELSKGAFKDPHEKIQIQTQLNEAVDKYAKVQRDAARSAVLADLEEAAAKRALTEQVVDYRAQLLLLQGDEAGAAALRAKQAIDNAKLFATRAGGLVSDADLSAQAKALEVANALAEAQRRVGIATADASRAEEAYLLIAANTGASLYERDTAVYAIRVKLVEQLKDAADKTRVLADAEKAAAAAAGRIADPRVLAAAGDAALQYAKALDQIDPALNRLRDAAKSTADSIADDIGGAINDFKGFPALIDSISKTLVQAGTKFFVTDPLKVGLENLFKQATEGDNPIGNFLQSVAGVGGGAGLGAQTAAVSSSTSALLTFTGALSAATSALGGQAGASTASSSGGLFGWLGGLFGSSSTGAASSTFASDEALALFFHSGGVVGTGGARGRVPASVFAGAQVLHSGGLAGLKSDEVPAILRRREEVLRRDDPRHRDNGGMRAVDMPAPITVHVQQERGMTRESGTQIGAAVANQLAMANRRKN